MGQIYRCPPACVSFVVYTASRIFLQVETKALLKSGVLGQCLSKKRSFTAADGVKPKAPPPKPRRVFEHIQETPEETQDRIRASTAVDRRHKRSSPSRTTDLHHNRTTSPSNGATSPSNLMAPPTATAATPTNQSEMTKFQQRPLPEPPVEMQTGQYVCDVSLPLGELCVCTCMRVVCVFVCLRKQPLTHHQDDPLQDSIVLAAMGNRLLSHDYR